MEKPKPDALQAAMLEAATKYGLNVHDESAGARFNKFSHDQLLTWACFAEACFGIGRANTLCVMIAQAQGMIEGLDGPTSIEYLEALLACRKAMAAGDEPRVHELSVALNDASCRLSILEAHKLSNGKGDA